MFNPLGATRGCLKMWTPLVAGRVFSACLPYENRPGIAIMQAMTLRGRFRDWVAYEVGSEAVPALREMLRTREYHLIGFTEQTGAWLSDVYHKKHGLFQAAGNSEAEALLGILRQVWLVESLSGEREEI